MTSSQNLGDDTSTTPSSPSADVASLTSAIEALLNGLPKGRALVEAAVAVLISVERGLRLRPGLTPKRRKLHQEKIAAVGPAAIERAAVFAEERGGRAEYVDFRPDATRSSLEYARAAIPLAQRCAELAARVEDDVLQEQEQITERTLLVVGMLRRAAKRDATLLIPLEQIESSRPPKRVRKKRRKD